MNIPRISNNLNGTYHLTQNNVKNPFHSNQTLNSEYLSERYQLPTVQYTKNYNVFFSRVNIDYISEQITLRLQGLRKDGRNIIVPDKEIISVMDSFYNNYYTDIQMLTMSVISYIVDYIREEYLIELSNIKLSNWVINDEEKRHDSKIKLQQRKTLFTINMRY